MTPVADFGVVPILAAALEMNRSLTIIMVPRTTLLAATPAHASGLRRPVEDLQRSTPGHFLAERPPLDSNSGVYKYERGEEICQ